MTWDVDSKCTVNTHFQKVGETCQAFGYMDYFTIDDVFKSVLLATLKSFHIIALRAACDQILDDLDNDKELTFAHIKTVCARQFRRRKERPDPPHCADTPRTPPAKPEKYNRYKWQGAHEPAVFFCNTLEEHGVRPEKVLRQALAGHDWGEPASEKPTSLPPKNTSPARSLVK
jgi:hypothetical protein